MITADVNQVKSITRYVRFCRKCLRVKIQIGNGRVKSLLDFGLELNFIKEYIAQQLDLLISSLLL